MKYATAGIIVLMFFNFMLVHQLKSMDAQSEQDEDVDKLQHLLSKCAIEHSIQAPPNTPSLLCSEDGSDTDLECCELFNCLVINCSNSYISFKLLQDHMFYEHGFFLCLCGGCFQEYLSYEKHCQSCSYYT